MSQLSKQASSSCSQCLQLGIQLDCHDLDMSTKRCHGKETLVLSRMSNPLGWDDKDGGVPKISRAFFGFLNKDYNILIFILGSPCLGKLQEILRVRNRDTFIRGDNFQIIE